MSRTLSHATVNSVRATMELTATTKQTINIDDSDDGDDTYNLCTLLPQGGAIYQQSSFTRLELTSSKARKMNIEQTTK